MFLSNRLIEPLAAWSAAVVELVEAASSSTDADALGGLQSAVANAMMTFLGRCNALLGTGALLPMRKFTGPRAARVLGRLLEDPGMSERGREYAARCSGANSVAAACDEVERTTTSPS